MYLCSTILNKKIPETFNKAQVTSAVNAAYI